jgi:uncharacterized SAM-binding protein YcdF (DUF218 family)
MITKLFAYCFTAFFTLVLFWALGWMWFAASVVSMKPQAQTTTTDAIIVLTGGEKRVNTGLDLLAEGKGKELFISGVNTRVKPQDLVKLWQGDHEKVLCCITLGYAADDTAGNATESLAWVQKENIKSIRLVTSNYHMARSNLIFEQAMPDIMIYKHPVVPDDFEPWGRAFWKLTFQEYTKFLAMWLRFDQINKNPSLNKDVS